MRTPGSLYLPVASYTSKYQAVRVDSEDDDVAMEDEEEDCHNFADADEDELLNDNESRKSSRVTVFADPLRGSSDFSSSSSSSTASSEPSRQFFRFSSSDAADGRRSRRRPTPEEIGREINA